jgi:hypothetical protein
MSRIIRVALICLVTAGSASLLTSACAGPDTVLGTEGGPVPVDSTKGNGFDNNN